MDISEGISYEEVKKQELEAMTDWEELSLWEKFTDKDPRRPAKTWRNRFFWTWPISRYTDLKVSYYAPRIKAGKQETSLGLKPYVEIRTTRFKGETYKNQWLSNAFRINWWGFFWGWR